VTSYPIRLFGDPVLKQRAREVEELDGSLAGIVDTMYDTMYEALGLGLAAPQVGVQKRLFTYDVGEGPTVVVNPEIVATSGEFAYEEGCLSVPGLKFEIVRPKVVTVRGVDLDGHEVVVEGDEQLGRGVPPRGRPSRRGPAARPARARGPQAGTAGPARP